MRTFLTMTALAAVIAAPSLAAAQTHCEQQRANNEAGGAVLGAIGGALLGSAIAGRGNHTTGAVIGGVGGAVAGGAIGGSSTTCPDGYVSVADPAYGPAPDGFYDADGRWHYNSGPYAATPVRNLHDQEDDLTRRIHAAQDSGRIRPGQADDALHDVQHLRDREADMRTRHDGRLTDDDRLYLQQQLNSIADTLHLDVAADAGPPPPAYPPVGAFWNSAPTTLRERADWLEHRINDDASRGALSERGAQDARDGLANFRQEAATLRSRDGGELRAEDRQYLNDRLDYLSRRIQWMESSRR